MTDQAEITLDDAKRQVAAERARDATRRLLRHRGFDVTMDEIADASGVSRRTLFRHFESREKLIASALQADIDHFGEQLPVHDGGDWRAWLTELSASAHRVQSGFGRSYWDLLHRTDLAAEIAHVNEQRRTGRREAMARVARRLWSASGREGAPPPSFVTCVIAHLSPRFTMAVTDDGGESWQTAAELAVAAISSALAGGSTDGG